jgi:hypothetical protein
MNNKMLSKAKPRQTEKKNKTFDAVQMMRDIREKLSLKYWEHPQRLKKDMDAIRKKYDLHITSQQTY